MIWAKTDAGRTEIQTRALVKERARRNLLLLIDGVKSEDMLLGGLTGISAEDFQALQKLALIAPVTGATRAADPPVAAAAGASNAGAAMATAPLDHGQFSAALTRLISSQLGLRGFVLTLAVEKAATTEELQAIAQRTLDQIGERKGEAAAAAARRTLYSA